MGTHLRAKRGEGRVRFGHLDRDHLRSANGGGGEALDGSPDSHAGGGLSHGLQPDLQAELDGDHVDGSPESLSDRDGPLELGGEVLWLPLFTAHLRHDYRGVHEDVGGWDTARDGGCVDEGLEGRASLAEGLGGPVELRLTKVAAAHHRSHVAGDRVQRHE